MEAGVAMNRVFSCLVLFLLLPSEALFSQTEVTETETFSVGFRLLEVQDLSRAVTGGTTSLVAHPRPVRTYLWYPSDISDEAKVMRFGRYADLADDDIWPAEISGDIHDKLSFSRRPLARSLGTERFEALKNEPVMAVEGATALQGPFPLIVMGQGLYYESPIVFAALAETLASQGFVVATTPLTGTNSPIVTMDVTGLETQVRDLEFVIAQARDLSFVSKEKLGVFGFDMGGMAGLVLTLRNADVDAYVSVSSGVLYPHPSSIPGASPDYDPAALRVPWLHSVPSSWIRSAEDKSLFDLAHYSDRYLLLTEGMGHVDYTSYALIADRPAMVEYWEAARPGDVERYTTLAHYVASFYAAFLQDDADALDFLSQDSADSLPDPIVSLQHRPAMPAGISYEEVVQAVIAGEADEAIDELRQLQETEPDHHLLNEDNLNRLSYSLRGTWRLDEEILPVLKFTAELYPTSADALYWLAEGHITLGDNPAAIAIYDRLLELDPNDSQNYIKARLEWLHSQ
jgi:dienelactone hydrolase